MWVDVNATRNPQLLMNVSAAKDRSVYKKEAISSLFLYRLLIHFSPLEYHLNFLHQKFVEIVYSGYICLR